MESLDRLVEISESERTLHVSRHRGIVPSAQPTTRRPSLQSRRRACFQSCLYNILVYMFLRYNRLALLIHLDRGAPSHHARCQSTNPAARTMRLPPSYAAIPTSDSALDNGLLSIYKKKGVYGENWSSLIGIITAIVGNVLISFALNMQRYAHIRLDREWQEKERQRKKRSASGTSLSRLLDGSAKDRRRNGASENDPLIQCQEEEEAEYKQKSYLKSPYWWAGIVLMTVGEAGNFLAYGFAPASIVSPLGVVALISNCIIAPFMLKEPFRKRDALGVIIAVGGAVTVVLSANDNNPKLGPEEILKMITAWEFETYLGVTVGVIAVLMWASNRYGQKNILIDLGLVGLFGMFSMKSRQMSACHALTRSQAATRLCQPRESHRSSPTGSGASSLSQSSTYSSSSWSSPQSCRSNTSTEHYNVSTLHKSSPYNSCSSRSPSFSGPPSCTATSSARLATTRANLSADAP
jgi:hypothetical protein